MKNFIYIILLAVIVSVSCSEQLKEIQPQQAVSEEAAFSNETNATATVIGLYGLSQDLEVFGSMPQIIADYQSDNVNFIGSFPTLQEINNYNTLANNTSIDQLYEDNYEVILAANAAIENIPNVPDEAFTDDERNGLIAESKFLRALVYFNLVNLFAHPFQVSGGTNDAIPLITTPFSGEVELPSRESLNDIHGQIEQDLLDAIAVLPATGDNSRATAGAARGVLARLYLYREQWTNAITQASVITSDAGTFPPAAGVEFYNSESSEYLMFISNTTDDNGTTGSGGWDSFYEPVEQDARGDCPFSADLLASYDASDLRLAYSEVGENGNTYTLKYDDAINNTSDAPIIRIGEVYLTHAEALAQEGQAVTQEILDLLNVTRTRAGLAAYLLSDFANVGELLDAIYNERRFELAFEGHRRMDLLRTGQSLRPATDDNFDESQPGDDLTILPIPQRERDLNSNLSQNNGY